MIPKEDIIDDKPIESPPPTQKIKTPVHMWSCCQNELKESKVNIILLLFYVIRGVLELQRILKNGIWFLIRILGLEN